MRKYTVCLTSAQQIVLLSALLLKGYRSPEELSKHINHKSPRMSLDDIINVCAQLTAKRILLGKEFEDSESSKESSNS